MATTTNSLSSSVSSCIIHNDGDGTVGINVSGTWTGTLLAQVTVDNTNWITVNVFPIQTGAGQASIVANGTFQVNVAGCLATQILTSGAITGTAAVVLRTAPGAAVTAGTSSSGSTVGVTGTVALAGGSIGVTGPISVQGLTSSGSIASGYPVEVGGVYQGGNPVSLASGAISALQVDSLGDLNTNAFTLGAGEDLTNNVLSVAGEFGYKFISQPTATWLLKSGAGLLNTITFGQWAPSGVIQVFDNTASSGTQIAQIGLPGISGPPLTVNLGIAFTTGLAINVPTAAVFSGTLGMTVSFK
jgi:hypothetical protein